MKLSSVPISLRRAKEFVNAHHRHNKAPQGGIVSVGASFNRVLVGVAILGRPISRHEQSKVYAEITRVCVVDNAPKNTCSFLYGKCVKVAHALGYKGVITYTLQSESGASLRGANFKVLSKVDTRKGTWNNKSRPRQHQDIYGQQKFKWFYDLV